MRGVEGWIDPGVHVMIDTRNHERVGLLDQPPRTGKSPMMTAKAGTGTRHKAVQTKVNVRVFPILLFSFTQLRSIVIHQSYERDKGVLGLLSKNFCDIDATDQLVHRART
jgi:hypothetical protein